MRTTRILRPHYPPVDAGGQVSTEKSETPRTQQAIKDAPKEFGIHGIYGWLVSHAEQLERELVTARRVCAEAVDELAALRQDNEQYIRRDTERLDELAAANLARERAEKELRALYKVADELCERIDYDLIDSGQWIRFGAATDAAEKFIAALATAQARGEMK